ncbi:hypothetical protein EST38_g3076 [Candolleomyces aberdarensis]|uniref:F-box domain-containing protein n=1 Tax=Candolleomyces aberdarensis TaxID=2316362 RepID=A0A4Q2DSY2_9AGAR|nr:hypothetical protein EST38_g3076 [Candolleomyces aberdarensis]
MELGFTTCKLLDLPPELLLLVLGQLDEAALCNLGCTCKDLNAIVFPYFFDKFRLTSPLHGWISCYPLPKHGLRAIRSCLSIKNINDITYNFSRDIETLMEEVQELHAIVKRLEVKDLELCLTDPDSWAKDRVATVPGTAASFFLPVLTTGEWTRLYADLLTASLTRGCKRVKLSGGHEFFNYLSKREQMVASNSVEFSRELTPRYFEESSRSESSSTAKPKRISRWIARVVSFGRKPEAPKSKLESLVLASDMLLSSTMFLDWTIQLFSWCAPTLTHLELQCHETSRETWQYFFSEIHLPSLQCFKIANGTAMIRPLGILHFLSKHPSIRTLLLLRGIQFSLPLTRMGSLPKPVLPSLEQVIAHPIYLRWLLRDKKQCPKIKEITLLPECRLRFLRSLYYDPMDRTLESILLPRSHKLGLIGFRFPPDHPGLDAWLRSHIGSSAAGGLNARSHSSRGVLPRFIHTKHLRIESIQFVDVVGSFNSQTGPSRLELIARFAGLFPNVEYLELLDIRTGADRIPPVVDAIRQHCPQVKKLKIGHASAIDIGQYRQSGSGDVVNVS